MERFWYAIMDDESAVDERGAKWVDIDASKIMLLGIMFDGRSYILPVGSREYIQAKTASVPIGGGTAQIESRYIGFRDKDREYCLRVRESDGLCSMEIR